MAPETPAARRVPALRRRRWPRRRHRREPPATGPGHYLRDLVYGALDGVVSTFAIVAGARGGGLGYDVIVILGLASLFADGVSMAAANYLGMKSEIQQVGGSVKKEKPYRHGLATLAAFVVAGAVPLAAFLVPLPTLDAQLLVASALAGLTFFAVGAARARFLPGRRFWWLGLEMFAVGVVAAGIAYVIGAGARALVG